MAKVEIHKGAAWFICPGCGRHKRIPFSREAYEGQANPESRPAWTFNGDANKPTFNPSILGRWTQGHGHWDDVEKKWIKEGPDTQECCHSFVRDGKIQFLADSTHTLAGQTVDLPDVLPAAA
jgi:hypothetical protein